ncbi:hypothetical protein [Nocardia sp. R7R-8]|uniref:hypothetical protein n=1 Tax=Nocardia sp. R7R-8 TaxID=3459304 RepID=UPI00403D5C57
MIELEFRDREVLVVGGVSVTGSPVAKLCVGAGAWVGVAGPTPQRPAPALEVHAHPIFGGRSDSSGVDGGPHRQSGRDPEEGFDARADPPSQG